MAKNEDDKKKTNPKPGRPLIPMKPKDGENNPKRDYIPGFEDMGPVKYAAPEEAKKDKLSGLTPEAGTKSLLKAFIRFTR